MKKQINQLPSVKKEINPNFILVNKKMSAVYQKCFQQQKQNSEQKTCSASFLIIDNQTGQIICE